MKIIPITNANGDTWFLPYQQAWILDNSTLKIMEKSRQVGISFADAFHSVIIASAVDNDGGQEERDTGRGGSSKTHH